MADVVHISTYVLQHAFDHVCDAINAWGDVDGEQSTFEYHAAKLIVMHRDGDLFIIADAERGRERLLFRSFDLRRASDLLAIFAPYHH